MKSLLDILKLLNNLTIRGEEDLTFDHMLWFLINYFIGVVLNPMECQKEKKYVRFLQYDQFKNPSKKLLINFKYLFSNKFSK